MNRLNAEHKKREGTTEPLLDQYLAASVGSRGYFTFRCLVIESSISQTRYSNFRVSLLCTLCFGLLVRACARVRLCLSCALVEIIFLFPSDFDSVMSQLIAYIT